MKKLTSLQVMMLMSLALGSSQVYSRESDEMKMEDDNEAIMLTLQSEQDEQAKMDVLHDLIQLQPKVAERVIIDEADLEATYISVRNFINKKNAEIEKLNKKDIVNEAEVARLAVELADVTAAFEKAQAKQRAKHKRDHRLEQSIKDALRKAEQGIKSLSKKTVSLFNQASRYVTKSANQAGSYISKSANQAGSYISKTATNASNAVSKPFAIKKKSKSKKNDEPVMDQPAMDESAMDESAMDESTGYDKFMMDQPMIDNDSEIIMMDQPMIDNDSESSDEVVA